MKVVNQAEVDMVVRDGVAGPREVVNPLTEDSSTALEIKKKSALRSRKSSLPEIPEDAEVVKGVKALAARCPNLATINLGGCAEITDEGVKALKNAHPNVTVQC